MVQTLIGKVFFVAQLIDRKTEKKFEFNTALRETIFSQFIRIQQKEIIMSKTEFLLVCLASLVCSSIQQVTVRPNFNPTTDGVVELKSSNFKTFVLNSDDSWLVDFQFSGEKCPYCIEISEVIKKAVPNLKAKKIKVGFVESYSLEGRKLADAYGLTGFPQLFLFGKDKTSPVRFIPYATNTAEEFATSVELSMNRSRPAEGICGQDSVEDEESNMYELTDDNLRDVVLKCEKPWLVNFYVPDISVCIQFMPFFEAAAKEFKGKVFFGSFFMVNSVTAQKYGVNRACTVKFFPAGDKNVQPIDYNKGFHSDSLNSNIGSWLRKTLAADLPTPEIYELTSQSVLDAKCKNSSVAFCMFFFGPKIDKCNSECQSTYLDQLKEIVNDTKAENWAWFSTTQGKQPMFEQTLGVTSFPGISAVDLQSKTYSTSRGPTSMMKLKDFVKSVANGIVPTKNLPSGGLPPVKA